MANATKQLVVGDFVTASCSHCVDMQLSAACGSCKPFRIPGDACPLDGVGEVAGGRPAEQARVDRPEFRAEQRHRGQPGRDVQALGDAVEADRS